MKKFEVFTGKNFTPLFKGAKAELITIQGSDGGPQAIGQFYNESDAQLIADLLNDNSIDHKSIWSEIDNTLERQRLKFRKTNYKGQIKK